MNKLFSLTGVGALLLAASFAFATPVLADPHGDAVGAGVAGGVLGFMAGAAMAGNHHNDDYNDDGYYAHHHRHRMSAYEQHVQDCEAAYGWRYDPDTDLVTRHHQSYPCDL